jgi:hypothetical protein
MPAGKRKALLKASAPGLVIVYESPAQIGFPGIATPLQIYGCFSCVRRGLLSGSVGGFTEVFAGVEDF